MKKINNESGFSAVELILVIAVIALLGVVGWLVYKNNHKTAISTALANGTSVTTKTKTTSTSATTVNPYSGWQSYTLKYEKLSFKYPANWVASDTSSSGIDNVTFTASDGYSFGIEDGVPPGGDPINIASSSPISVSFIGNSDYIVFTNPPTPVPSVVAQPNIATGALLLTNPNNYLSYPADKNVTNTYNTSYGQSGSNLSVSMAYTTSPNNKLTLTQAASNKEFIDSKLVIQSMTY